MIRSFEDRETEILFFTGKSRRHNSIASVARRKIQVLDNTRKLDDLKEPAGNRLEARNRLEPLRGDRKGQHSIRINDQYRICFVWFGSEPCEVKIADYH